MNVCNICTDADNSLTIFRFLISVGKPLPAGGCRGAPGGGALRGREPVHHPRPPRDHHAQGHSARPKNTRTSPGVDRDDRDQSAVAKGKRVAVVVGLGLVWVMVDTGMEDTIGNYSTTLLLYYCYHFGNELLNFYMREGNDDTTYE